MESITVSWFDESHTLLVFVVKHPVTLEDYLQAVRYSRKLVRSAKPAYYSVIADVSDMRMLPPRFIAHMRKEYKVPDGNFSKITVFVGASRVVKYLENVFREIFAPHQFLFADTLEDAVKMLQQTQH